MLLPAVLIFLAIYWAVALFYLRWARARDRENPFPLLWAWAVCLLLLFGDHVAGYLWFKWYTATISVPGPVTLITSDMAVEDYDQDAAQKKEEGGGVGGVPPIFDAWNAASYFWTPIQYSSGSGSSIADITTGLSRLEVVDMRYRQLHPNEPPRVRRYSIVKRPDQRCHDFENQSSERRKAQYESMAAHGLLEPKRYCIAFEITHQVTARYTTKYASTNYLHPRRWTLAALGGVYPGTAQYIDNQTGQVVFENKGANFYGGWVWQFVRFLPDMDYTVASASINTVGLDAPCCKKTHIPGINLLPYEISP